MRIVLLTARSRFAIVALRRLKADGIAVDGVVIEDPPVGARLDRAARDLSVPALAALAVRKARAYLLRERRYDWERFDAYRPLCGRVHVVQDRNSPVCETLLRGLAPDIVVLGSCRIIRQPIIDIPRLGTLNAHPGLLPAYRGLDTIEWSVLNGDDPGVTVHFVDAGIDTGPVIVREKIPLQRRDTLHRLQVKATDLSARMLSEALSRLIAGEAIVPQPQRREEGRLYHALPRRLQRETKRRLAQRVSSLGS